MQLGRSQARIAIAAQAVLLAVALVIPATAAASTVGFNLLSPSVSTVAYSDLVTLRGSYTCINDAAGNCPTTTQSQTATFAVRLSGDTTFLNVATVATSFTFTSSAGGCPTTCTVPFQVTWRAGRAGTTTVAPGVYDLRLSTTISAAQPILLGALTIVQEGSATTYGGATAGAGGDPLALSASVVDLDRGIGTGNGIITPDTNLAGAAMVTFELYDATNTTLIVGPVSSSLSAGGLTFGSPSLALPTAGGSFRLRATFVGNGFYTTSADLDTITVTPSNTAPVLQLPAGPIVVEATSPVGATVTWSATATDSEDEPDPIPTCDELSGDSFPVGDTTVTCTVTDSGGLDDVGSFVIRVVDTTDPSVVVSTTESAGTGGWFNSASNDGSPGVTVDVTTADLVGPATLTCTDNGVSVGALPAAGGSFVLGDGQHAIECTVVDGAGNDATAGASFDIDQTAPTIGGTLSSPPAESGWWNASTGAPGVTFACLDAGSGVASCSDPIAFGEGASQAATGVAVDVAGNSASSTVSGISVDVTAPAAVTFAGGGLVDGGAYDFWFVPEGPTGCGSSDALSGPASCVVSGYSGAVGSQAVSGLATDAAGNSATASLKYQVRPWTLVGFGKPVEMTGFNALKAGGSILLKLEVLAGTTKLATADVIAGIDQQRISCTTDGFIGGAGGPKKPPHVDAAGGQLSTRWTSPDQAGTCWLVTLRTADGSSLSAAFRLK